MARAGLVPPPKKLICTVPAQRRWEVKWMMCFQRQAREAVAVLAMSLALVGAVWIACAQDEQAAEAGDAPPSLEEVRQALAAETTDPVADADESERFVVSFRFAAGWWTGDGPAPTFEELVGREGQVPPSIPKRDFFDEEAMARIANRTGRLDVRVSPIYSLVCSAEVPGRAELKAPNRYFSWEATATRTLGDNVRLDVIWKTLRGPRGTDEFFGPGGVFYRDRDGNARRGLKGTREFAIGEAYRCLCQAPGPEQANLVLCYLLVEEAWP